MHVVLHGAIPTKRRGAHKTFFYRDGQGRSWENGLEKYIVVEVYLCYEKYNLSLQKSIIRPILM